MRVRFADGRRVVRRPLISYKKKSDRMNFSSTKLQVLLACWLLLGASAAGAVKPITGLHKALAAAEAQGRPVFIYVFDSL